MFGGGMTGGLTVYPSSVSGAQPGLHFVSSILTFEDSLKGGGGARRSPPPPPPLLFCASAPMRRRASPSQARTCAGASPSPSQARTCAGEDVRRCADVAGKDDAPEPLTCVDPAALAGEDVRRCADVRRSARRIRLACVDVAGDDDAPERSRSAGDADSRSTRSIRPALSRRAHRSTRELPLVQPLTSRSARV